MIGFFNILKGINADNADKLNESRSEKLAVKRLNYTV